MIINGINVHRLLTFGPVRPIRARIFSLSVFCHLILNRRNYDVIHVVSPGWHCTLSILAARLLGKRVIFEMILLGSDDPRTIARRRWGKLTVAVWKRMDRLASLSTALTQSALDRGFTPEKLVQIPVGVDIQRFHPVDEPEKKALRSKLGLPLNGKLIVFVGGVIARKGVDLLIDALPDLVARQPDAGLVLVGPTSLDESFVAEQKRKIQAANLEAHVVFAGRVTNVPDYLQAADVFTLPSKAEGLPNSVLEAMACGLPPVISNMPDISQDMIRSPAEGFIVAERTPEGFTAVFTQLLNDSALRREIGKAARMRIVSSFSITYRAEQYQTLYQSLVNQN